MNYSVFYHHASCAAQEWGCTMDEMFDQLYRWGIRYIELDRDALGGDEESIMELSRLMGRHGLKPSSIYGFFSWEQDGPMPEKDDLLIRQAKLLGCERVMVIPGFYSDLRDPARCAREKARMIEGTRRMTELAAAQGLTVTIECFDHEKSPIATIGGMAEFLEGAPLLRVTLETGNFRFSGDDILRAQQLFRDKVCHVHLKDRYLPALAKGGKPENVLVGEAVTAATGEIMHACPVGQGHIPMGKVLDELKAWGYGGIMTIEHFGAASYADAIRESMAWLKNWENA